ncbi:hypothetical protein CI726_16985, partial [Shigella sonnei]
ADRNRSHWSTSKTPSYTKSVSWQHHPPPEEDNFTASRKLAAGCKNIMVRRTNQLNGVPHR